MAPAWAASSHWCSPAEQTEAAGQTACSLQSRLITPARTAVSCSLAPDPALQAVVTRGQ